MKLFFAIRGIKFDTDRFITELQGKYFPYKTDNGDYQVQMNVQPIQLYCLGFPREQLQTVLRTLNPSVWHNSLKFLSKMLRKFLKLKPVPKIDETNPGLPIFRPNAEIVPIGIFEDDNFTEGQFKGGEAI
jgi:hypothetical protein